MLLLINFRLDWWLPDSNWRTEHGRVPFKSIRRSRMNIVQRPINLMGKQKVRCNLKLTWVTGCYICFVTLKNWHAVPTQTTVVTEPMGGIIILETGVLFIKMWMSWDCPIYIIRIPIRKETYLYDSSHLCFKKGLLVSPTLGASMNKNVVQRHAPWSQCFVISWLTYIFQCYFPASGKIIRLSQC